MSEMQQGGMEQQGGAAIGGQTAGQGQGPQPGSGRQGGPGVGGTQGAAAAAAGFRMPEKFTGKSTEDVAKSYVELEGELGRLRNEMGESRKAVEQWQRFWQGWEPYLRAFEYNPERLAAALEQAADRAGSRGQARQAQNLDAAAQQVRTWGDALTPDQQQQWIEQYVGDQVSPLQQSVEQRVMELAQGLINYINRYGDLAIRAIDKKFENPKLAIGDLLQEAVRIASNQYDPLEWAARIKTQPSLDDLREQIRQEERARIDQENKNRQVTTFVGAGGTGRTSLRPANPRGEEVPPPRRSQATSTMAQAKEGFLRDWNKIVNPSP